MVDHNFFTTIWEKIFGTFPRHLKHNQVFFGGGNSLAKLICRLGSHLTNAVLTFDHMIQSEFESLRKYLI